MDIVDTPLSFNVGLNDHIELFYKTNGYRGVKVNNPQNLSSFYLPNSQLFFGATLLCSGAAAILPPERVSGSTALTGFSPLFRPAGPPCNVGGQPFVGFPFIGGTGPNFGLTGNAIAPPFTSRIGTPFGGNGSFGAASNFPGMGSTVGSILPGIVLSGHFLPANLTFNPIFVPTLSPLLRAICRTRRLLAGYMVNRVSLIMWWARRSGLPVRTMHWVGESFRSTAGGLTTQMMRLASGNCSAVPVREPNSGTLV